MENLLLYLLKVILCSGVMFLYYRIFLKDKTFHHYNRFYLLGTLVVSLLLPFLKVANFTINVNQDIYDFIRLIQSSNSSKTSSDGFTIYQVIFVVGFLVSLFFLGKFIFGLLKINRIKKDFPQENFEGISFYNTNLENAPFSFFRNLFWKKSILIQSDLGKQILKHEMVHIEQKHTYDKVLIEILTALFWFNPIFYLIKKELHLIHEYLADKKALKNSDTKAFAQMLLETHFSGTILPATSPFLNSNLKKRIIMLKKSKTKFSYWRKVLALPLLFSLVFAYMVKAENTEIKKNNLAISAMVSSLKNDTIKTDTLSPVRLAVKKYPENTAKFYASEAARQAKLDSEQAKEDGTQAILDAKQARVDAKIAQIDAKQAQEDQIQAQKDAKFAKEDAKLNNQINNYHKVTIENPTNNKKETVFVNNQQKLFINGVENNSTESILIKAENRVIGTKKSKDGNNEIWIQTNGNNYDKLQILKSDEKQNLKLNDEKIRYFVNGKLQNNEALKNLSPGKIKSINVTKNPGQKDGGNIFILTKNSNSNTENSGYDKIVINGKVSTQANLDKIKKDSIKTQNIKRNTKNGKSYSEIRVRTK